MSRWLAEARGINQNRRMEGEMSTKNVQEELVTKLRRWQKIENAAVASTGKIIERTENPVIRLVMEIIQRDSQMHFRIQELIIDSLSTKSVSLTPEELEEVWGAVEEHVQLEKKTVELAGEALAALEGKKMVAQEYLLEYLLRDESKHDHILESLETIKKGMYPYG